MYLWVRLTSKSKPAIITVMDDMLYDELFERLDRAITQINAVKSKVAKRDLVKMVRAIDGKMTAVDQEKVECRRLHKETPRYRELRQQAHELVDNLEKHITFAALIG
jgi:hypothetical protein